MTDEVFVLPHPPRICDECIKKKPMYHVPSGIAYLHCQHHRAVASYNTRVGYWSLWSPIDEEAFVEGAMAATEAFADLVSRKAD